MKKIENRDSGIFLSERGTMNSNLSSKSKHQDDLQDDFQFNKMSEKFLVQ